MSFLRIARAARLHVPPHVRTVASQAASKRSGDISDAFASLSGQDFRPLAPEYAGLKARLVGGNEEAVRQSWERLLADLKEEVPLIVEKGSAIIPEIDFRDIDDAPAEFSSELKRRGVAVVRGVVGEQEALSWKEDLREYIRRNPQTKGMLSAGVMYDGLSHIPQHFHLKTLRSSSSTGHGFNCLPAAIRTCLRCNASSCLTGTLPTQRLLYRLGILLAMLIDCACVSLVMQDSP